MPSRASISFYITGSISTTRRQEQKRKKRLLSDFLIHGIISPFRPSGVTPERSSILGYTVVLLPPSDSYHSQVLLTRSLSEATTSSVGPSAIDSAPPPHNRLSVLGFFTVHAGDPAHQNIPVSASGVSLPPTKALTLTLPVQVNNI